ncbi:hypothetical protein [Paenibacillus albus]|uniref:Uncharacterized protein n=1 Tax=Paenibacillus albus TaxID=2495582 RepID=A0A3S9AC06_9BACL|nr:hypothetical protein [Paenibacillus albus]AZN43254.1 hypothetical protein EJC50_28865 [Paenibacillus albus]
MSKEYRMITAGVFAGKKRMKLHFIDNETEQILCGAHLSEYETRPREGVRVCKRCEAVHRRRGGTILEPVDIDAWLEEAYPDLMEDTVDEAVMERPAIIKEGH